MLLCCIFRDRRLTVHADPLTATSQKAEPVRTHLSRLIVAV